MGKGSFKYQEATEDLMPSGVSGLVPDTTDNVLGLRVCQEPTPMAHPPDREHGVRKTKASTEDAKLRA